MAKRKKSQVKQACPQRTKGLKYAVRPESVIAVPAKGYRFVAGKPCPVKFTEPKRSKR